MVRTTFFGLLALLPCVAQALRWDPKHLGYNLNENQEAINPTDYWGEWKNHTYHPSPSNWRFPFYVLTIDRYVDGDPTNNEANGTVFEHNWMTNQFRFGGDVKGLQHNLDYIRGMGIKVNPNDFNASCEYPRMWGQDGYPLDRDITSQMNGCKASEYDQYGEIKGTGAYPSWQSQLSNFASVQDRLREWRNDVFDKIKVMSCIQIAMSAAPTKLWVIFD
ncbi:MAG: hypothetical protein Q9181_003014 [Wetmoreana brouardii]